MTQHASDCAVHNAPATEPRPCDCGATQGREALYAARGALKTEWKQYRRTNVAEMRPYVPGEDTSGMSVSGADQNLWTINREEFDRGMIARNPTDHAEQWYVARAYFDANFEPL